MAKRFTDNEKWDDPFFLDMPNDFKLVYLYMLDKCDQVGVWKVNKRMVEFCIGKIDWDLFISYMGDRIYQISDEKWWLVKFCDFQYGELNEESTSKPIISHVKLLKKHTLWKGYAKGIETLKVKDKVKEKVKDKVKVKDKEEVKVKNKDGAETTKFNRALKDFEEMRKKIKKPLTDRAKELILKKLSQIAKTEEEQIEILNTSTMNCWQGVFEINKRGAMSQHEKGINNILKIEKELDDEWVKKYT